VRGTRQLKEDKKSDDLKRTDEDGIICDDKRRGHGNDYEAPNHVLHERSRLIRTLFFNFGLGKYLVATSKDLVVTSTIYSLKGRELRYSKLRNRLRDKHSC
jgi:hypothetical protein